MTFTERIDLYCEGIETVAVGCRGSQCEHADGDEDHSCESYFSSAQCDSCGSNLAGDRLPASGLIRDAKEELQIVPMEICVDCVMFHANGELPEGETCEA